MSDFDYEDAFEEDHEEDYEFDCGQVDDKRLCVDAGSEHCDFWCPYSSWVMAQDATQLPDPPGEDDSELPF